MSAASSVVRADLEVAGDFARDVELIITFDRVPTIHEAKRILEILFPIYKIVNVEVTDV